ncbi:hypothetical protein ABEU98_30090 [Priestia megaterium]|uniref:DUF7668 domain-containing protein n=1 Tax=Priestia TaxID=2800373 RepID=UPI00188EC652|nr:hypothetical protein [Priestia megaterium]
MITDSLKRETGKKLKVLIDQLVEGNIENIVSSGFSELTEAEIREELQYYPGKMNLPPNAAYQNWGEEIDIYEIGYKPPPNYEGTINLYYDGEQSDLTLKFNIYVENNDEILIKIRDLDVM